MKPKQKTQRYIYSIHIWLPGSVKCTWQMPVLLVNMKNIEVHGMCLKFYGEIKFGIAPWWNIYMYNLSLQANGGSSLSLTTLFINQWSHKLIWVSSLLWLRHTTYPSMSEWPPCVQKLQAKTFLLSNMPWTPGQYQKPWNGEGLSGWY